MNLIIVILLINCLHLFGDPMGGRINKNQLRGMHKKYLEKLLQESFVTTFDSIYQQIIDSATLGKNEYQFTIMCRELPNSKCDMHNGHEDWKKEYPNNIISTTNSYITIEQYTTNVINALKQTFLDSNITKFSKNCCNYHIIQW